MAGCIAEIAAAMIQILANPTENRRRIVDRYASDIPNVDPQQVLLQLRVCYGLFTKLTVRTRNWRDIGLKSKDRGALYQLIPSPGTPPVFFTVTADGFVTRVKPPRMPETL
jgi:hypothetical protein